MLTRKLFEEIKQLEGEQRLEVLRFLLADAEPEIFVPDPPALDWPPLRPDAPKYAPLPRVYTENYYEAREEIAFVDPEEGDFTLPAGSRLLFLGDSFWSRKSGWEMHMWTVDKFPQAESYAGPDATDFRMVYIRAAQLRALDEELTPEDRDRSSHLLNDDDSELKPFTEFTLDP